MPPRSGHRRLAWFLVWAAIALALLGRATSRPSSRGVILDHLEFGRRLAAGEDVYGLWRSGPDAPPRPLHAPYPPSFGLLTAPFAAIDAAFGQRGARFAWTLLQVLALGALALALRGLTAPRAPPEPRWQWLWLCTFVITARFVLRDTHGGGGNLINVALCVLAFARAERGRPRTAGLLLAFSLLTKPNQLWLLPVFWLFGLRRAVGWTLLAGCGGVLLTLALQRFDVAPWLCWLEGSLRLGIQADPWATPALAFPPFEWMNQALRFCVARCCGSVPPEFAERVALGVWPGLGLSVTAVGWIARGLGLCILGGLGVAAWRARAHAAARLWVLAAALVASLLLSPLSWKAHHVALLPVLFLLVQRAIWARSRPALAALAGFFVVCALPGGDLVGDDVDEWLNSLYVVTIWDLVLFTLALLLARRAANAARSAA
jgi:hypothetical protein